MENTKPRRDEMVRIILETVAPVGRTETVPFHAACGRVLAESVYSRNTLPDTPVSRFDGIGVRFADFAAGAPDTSRWQCGREYVFCNTGIAMPEGFDTVIAIENVTFTDTGLVIGAQPEARGQMVNRPGSAMKAGELLAAAGCVVTPAHVGLFASGGAETVRVYARPRVAVLPTGDELVPPTDHLPLGKNIDSNSYMIASYLRQWGAEPVRLPIVGDDPERLEAALREALAGCDAAAIIAGSSLGTKDYTLRILGRLGRVVVPELAHGPGRKSSLSVVEGKPVLGVAGPPLGAQITCDLYLSPFVSALRGLPPEALRRLEVISDDPFAPYDVDFCERVHIYRSRDGYHIRSAFAPATTRAQMQALSNGNYYRPAGSACTAGGTTEVELLCPIGQVPDRDLLPEILKED